MGITLVSENYFKYDDSSFAQHLRKLYGEDGYEKYIQKIRSLEKQTNPIALTKAKYIDAKEEDYRLALANCRKASSAWDAYKNNYATNLNRMRANNNGLSLTANQKHMALLNSGDGAQAAYRNYNNAQANLEFALSLYNDAVHDGIPLNYLS